MIAPPKVAHFRSHCVTYLWVNCADLACNHQALMSIEGSPDDLVLGDLMMRMRCAKCGLTGAGVRPDWRPRKHGTRCDSTLRVCLYWPKDSLAPLVSSCSQRAGGNAYLAYLAQLCASKANPPARRQALPKAAFPSQVIHPRIQSKARCHPAPHA